MAYLIMFRYYLLWKTHVLYDMGLFISCIIRLFQYDLLVGEIMTKEKLNALIKYQNSLKDRLSSDIPEKHKNHPESFKSFLKNELRLVTSKIEAAKLEGIPSK